MASGVVARDCVNQRRDTGLYSLNPEPDMPSATPRSSLRLKKATPKAAALKRSTAVGVPPKEKTPSKSKSTKRPGSRAVERTPKKKLRSARTATPVRHKPTPTTNRPAALERLAHDLFGTTADESNNELSQEQELMTEPAAVQLIESEAEESDGESNPIGVAEEEEKEEDAAAEFLGFDSDSELEEPRRRTTHKSFVEHLLTMTDEDTGEGTDDSSGEGEGAEDDSSGEDDIASGDDEADDGAVKPAALLAMVQLSIDAYTSQNTGLMNSTIVIDPRRSEANQAFIRDGRKFIGVSKWNKQTMEYTIIHQLQVNHLLVGVTMRDNSTRLSFDAYGVPQKRLVKDFNNDMQALIAALNTHINPFGFQFESNSDAPLLMFNFTRESDNSNYLHGHTFFLDEFIMDELGSSVSYNGKRMYRLHPGIKLKHGARKLHQYLHNKGIKATEIKVKGQTFKPVF